MKAIIAALATGFGIYWLTGNEGIALANSFLVLMAYVLWRESRRKGRSASSNGGGNSSYDSDGGDSGGNGGNGGSD